jgi:hypothetical protein
MKTEPIIIKQDVPSYIEKEFKPMDIYAWAMTIIGMGLFTWCILLPSLETLNKWFYCLTIAFFTFDYVLRILHGRVCKLVWYNTFMYNMYEIRSSGDTFFVCSPSEEDLSLYMDAIYPNIQYVIIDTHIAESFQKTEQYK